MSWESKQFHWNLITRRFGREILYLDETDSTNRWLSENLSHFALPGSIVVADHQNAGRGRHARSWLDHPGHSLLFSLLLRSSNPVERPGFLSLLPAISLARVLSAHDPSPRVLLKWPNDLLVGGKKIAGVLAEAHQLDGSTCYVVGVGVNVSQTSSALDGANLPDASSIYAQSSWRPSREVVLAHLLNEWEPLFDMLLEGKYDDIRREWERFGAAQGSPIRRCEADVAVDGSFVGLGEFGQLIMTDVTGQLREFHSGDVVLL